MSKRRSDTQLTKDDYEAQMSGGYNFEANRGNSEERPDETDPSKMADSMVMKGRKIAPLKKGRGRGGALGSRGGGSNLPNFFAGTPSPSFGANGNAQQPADGGMGFGGFGTPNTASPAPTFGGNATGGGTFSFGGNNNNAPEQPKINPFGSLAPVAPGNTNGGGIFGQTLFGSPAPQPSALGGTALGGMFGSSNSGTTAPTPKPASGGFTFSGNNSNTATTQSPATAFGKAPTFSFNGGSTAPPAFGSGDSKPAPAGSTSFTFGSNTPTPAVTPPITASFNFGASTATAPAAGNYFGAPSPAPEKTPEPPATPTAAPPSFLFGGPTPTQSSSLFGKSEPQGSSLFGRPSPSPEPSSNMFAAQKPAPSPEPPNLFGTSVPAATNFFGTPKAPETPKPAFGGFGEQKQEPAKDTPKSFFTGFGNLATEANKEAPNMDSPFGIGISSPKDDDDSAMAGNSPPKQSIFDSQAITNNGFPSFGTTPTKPPPSAPLTAPLAPPMFAPTTSRSTPTIATTNSIRTPSPPTPTNSPSWTHAQLTEYYNLYALRSLNYSFTEGLKKAGAMGDYSAACEVYIRESAKIRAAQEDGERYKGVDGKSSSNKRAGAGEEVEGSFKRRKEGEDSKSSDSSKALAGIIGCSSSAPDLTQKQASKPVFGFEPPRATGSTAIEGPKLASKPLFAFNPPTSMSSNLGQKLASAPVYDFSPPTSTPETSEGTRLASKPLFGFQPPASMEVKLEKKTGGSVFDNPTAPANHGGFVNPFTSNKPDPNDRDMDDEESDGDDKQPSGTSSAGSLFGRVSEPKASTQLSGSIFGTPSKSTGSGLFSSRLDQTWSPDKGVKFGEPTNGNGNGSIFGAKASGEIKPVPSFFGSGSAASSAATTPGASATSSIFGAPGPKPEVGFSFGGNGTTKPSGPISIPSSREATAAPEDASEPNDNAHLAKNEVDLSAQGPGEEDEDSLFQVRAIIYEVVGGGAAPKKAGVGTLRVLKNRITNKARVVTRTEGGKVVLNVGLVKEVSYGLGDKGGKNVSVVEFLQGKKPRRFSVRVKEEEMAKKLGEVMEDAKGS